MIINWNLKLIAFKTPTAPTLQKFSNLFYIFLKKVKNHVNSWIKESKLFWKQMQNKYCVHNHS